MKFHHRFTAPASLTDVAAFHRRAASMSAITPPPIIVQVHAAPPLLEEGDIMDFTLWLGPLPLRWLARIEQVTPISFVDRQVRGPFALWVHHHTFVPMGDHATVVIDEVEAVYRAHWFWRLVGGAMWLGMPALFAYRAWKTKRLLARRKRQPAPGGFQ